MYPDAELELESRSVASHSGVLPQKWSGIRRKDIPFVVPLFCVRYCTSVNFLVLVKPQHYKEPNFTDKETETPAQICVFFSAHGWNWFSSLLTLHQGQ